MRTAIAAFFALTLLTIGSASAQQYSGTWALERSSDPGKLQLTIRYEHVTATGRDSWDESRDVDANELQGISFNDLDRDQQKSFQIVRDAGVFSAQGSFGGGHAAGIWTLQTNPSFGAQLQRRGIGTPNAEQQFELAMGDFKLSTLDQLLASGFQRPSIDDLARMVEHGVSDKYITEIRGLGLHPKSVDALVRMRDHGVSGRYATAILKVWPSLSIDDLVWLRDHGVSEAYVAALRQAGYSTDARQAVELRDHGVSSAFIDDLAKIGYHPSASDLVRLRDHGVSAAFIERLRSHGYTKLSVDDLIRLRDSGF